MAHALAARATAMKSVEAIFERYNLLVKGTNFSGFDNHIMSAVKLIDASPEGTVVFELDVTPNYGNLNGVMHGGAAGLIFDMCTTSALGPLAKPGYWDFLGGVTRSLNISYLRAIPIGTKIHVTGQVQQVGRTMAMIRGAMKSIDGKTTYCTVEHHKVAVPTRPDHLKPEYETEWDREWAAKVKRAENGAKL